MNSGPEFLMVLAAAYLSGVVNATVGGGGLIQLTGLLAAFPQAAHPYLLGTNKVASIFGTAAAVVRYSRAVAIPWHVVLPACVIAFVGSVAGAATVARLPADAFRTLVPVMLTVVLAYVVWDRDLGQDHTPRPASWILLSIAGTAFLALGFFDGFFGPGVGTFLILVFVRLFGYDFLRAAACSRAVNLSSNVAAVALFAHHGRVWWTIGVLMALFNVAGAVTGTWLAVRRGNRFLRRLLIAAASLLIAKTAWDAWT